ncbi:immunoglobulin heavy chain variable region [Pelobates cultripes]|nr:immunoglobulin heavy chain variable region [Pelobates cultripes]
MRAFYIVLPLLISGSYVLSQTVTLDQPGSAVVKPSETLKIPCKVSVSVTSATWVWVRQKAGSALEYIGYIASGGGTSYASIFQGKVTFTRDTSKNELYFEMPNMRSDDSGTYYCARYTVTEGNQNSL